MYEELTQLDELRTELRAISARLASCTIQLDQLRNKIENAYYIACSKFNLPLEIEGEIRRRILKDEQ